MAKARDLVALYMDARETPVPPRAARLAELVRRRHNVTIRSADLHHLDREMALLKLIYNDAWTRNWGFVPWSDEEIEYSAADLKMVIDPDLVFFAFVDGEPAGFSLALPDFHQVLWYRRRIDLLRVVMAGIRHQFRNLALDAVFYYETYTRGVAKGYWHGEFSWVLEDNHAMRNTLEKMGARVYQRYRIYERRL